MLPRPRSRVTSQHICTTHDVEHLEYHGALFLRSKLRQEKITIWLSTSAAHQHLVIEPGHGFQVSHLCRTSRQRIAPGLWIMPAIGMNQAAKTLQANPMAARSDVGKVGRPEPRCTDQ